MDIKTTKQKAVVYCRVSSKEQQDTGYSLDAQEKLLTEYANKNDLKVEKIYRISGSVKLYYFAILTSNINYGLYCRKVIKNTTSMAAYLSYIFICKRNIR